MKWFRFKGLITFILLTAVLLCFWFVLADILVRRTIEKTASTIVGAEVNIRDLDLTLSPLGISVLGLEVTNPDNPLTNAVEVNEIVCSLDAAQAFLRKVIIEEMSINGMAFNTQRASPGFIIKSKDQKKELPSKKDARIPALPVFTRPDIAAILKDEDLKTLRLIQEVRGEIKSRKAQWERKLNEIPDQENLEQYQDRIDKIKKTDRKDPQSIMSAATQMKSLQDDIKTAATSLKEAQIMFNEDLKTINTHLKMVQEAPGEDIRNLMNKYGFNPAGIGNVSALLFGGKTGVWVERCLHWYQRINPIIQRTRETQKGKKVVKPLRAKGMDVHFKEYAPLPDFLIRSASASINLEAGVVRGTLKNITPDQDILGSPFSFDFSGDRLKGLTSIALRGYLNRTDLKKNRDHLELALNGYATNKIQLGADAFPVILEKGILDAHITTDIVNDNISAQLKSTVSAAHLTIPELTEITGIYSSLASAFSNVNDFTILAELKGTTGRYTVDFSSNLEKVMASALNKAVSDLAEQFEQEVKAAVQAKTSAPINSLKDDTASLDGLEKELGARINLADTLLKNAVIAPSGKGSLKLPF